LIADDEASFFLALRRKRQDREAVLTKGFQRGDYRDTLGRNNENAVWSLLVPADVVGYG
jgi:hypothetical protein